MIAATLPAMRRIIGLLIVLYSLLLAFNTTVPLIAKIAGEQITAVAAEPADCSEGFGSPPFAGYPASCEVTWQSSGATVAGTLYGQAAEEASAQTYELPGLTGLAFTAPDGNTEGMMAFLAIPILFFGLYVLFGRKRRRRRSRSGHGHDHDDDDDDDSDSDSGDSGDSGGDGGGGGD
jgi:hypothetical protein